MKAFLLISMVVLLGLASGCGVEQVDEGYRGIKTTWGKVEGTPLTPGLYFYVPVVNDIFEMDVREHKYETETVAFTKDTQSVKVSFTVTVYPKQDKIAALYSQFGKDWHDKVVGQVVLGSMKDAIGKYIADELVQKREEAKNSAQSEMTVALAARDVVLTRLDFTNLDFDDAYEKAVEAKVVATQRAQEAKNKTIQVEEEAKQTIKAAQADAESMRIKSQALSQNQNLVSYEIAKRWDGRLPSVVSGNSSGLIMNFSELLKEAK